MSGTAEGDVDKTTNADDDKEKHHFERIINAFRYYRTYSVRRVLLAEKRFNELSEPHKALIPFYKNHLRLVRTCMEHNAEILALVVSHTDHMFENRDCSRSEVSVGSPPASEFDMDKVKSTLRQVARDWSEEGRCEREQCYQPVIDEILTRFPDEQCDPGQISILVPGAGLGRLAFEIARRGFRCQGNEFSLFMLFMSHFILNRCKEVNLLTLYPWAHQFTNNREASDQTRPIHFPDINPAGLQPGADFSMGAGDFLEVYTESDSWDCVATVFFIDTAHNIMSYIETIYKILRPGGYWINLGPLLYHFADMTNDMSIELSYDQVKEVIQKLNFEIVKEVAHCPAGYTQNYRSMLTYQYDGVFFVARKPTSAPS